MSPASSAAMTMQFPAIETLGAKLLRLARQLVTRRAELQAESDAQLLAGRCAHIRFTDRWHEPAQPNAKLHTGFTGVKATENLPSFEIWQDSPEQACAQAARILPDHRPYFWHTGTVTSELGFVFTLPVVKP